MRIKEFIIHNYKSIRSDIKKCHVIVDGSVTILIGANNSGKTNILEALSKFSSGNFLPEEDIPYTSEAFKWDDANQSKLPMVEVTFVLDDGDSVRLQEVHPELGKQDTLTLLRDCGGHLSITDPKIDTVAVRIQLVDQLKAAISKLQRPVRLNMAAHNRNRDIATPSSRRASSRFGILFAEINNFDHALTPADVAKTQTKFRRFRRALSNLEIQTDRFDNEVARPLEDIDDLLGDLAKYAESQPDEELLSDIIPSFMLVDATPEHWL